LWDLDYITSKQQKLYTQMVQGLADYARIVQACMHGSTQPFAYFIANGWAVPCRLLAIIMQPIYLFYLFIELYDAGRPASKV